MGSSPTPPTVTDPNVTASNQQNLNNTAATQSQLGSSTNQNNAFGSLSYTQTGTSPDGTPIYTANTSLSAPEQGLFNTGVGTQQSEANQAQALISGANYGGQSPTAAIGNATQGLEGQAVTQEQAYLQPFFQPQTSQLDTQLRNQGFNPSDPAYKQAMNNLLQSQGQTESGFVASTLPQMFSQAQSEYNEPAQLAGSLQGLSSPTTPNSSFVNTPQLNIAPANLIGATANAQSAQQQTYQDQLQQQNALMSGLFGIPTAVLGGLAKGAGGSLLGAGGLGAGSVAGAGGSIGDAAAMMAAGLAL